jgi:hypothetical protein
MSINATDGFYETFEREKKSSAWDEMLVGAGASANEELLADTWEKLLTDTKEQSVFQRVTC